MITTDELKVQLADYGTAVKDLEEALAIDASRKRVQELEHTMSRPGFYVKLVLMALVNAFGVYGIMASWAQGEYWVLAALAALLNVSGASIEWGYLNSGVHDAQRDHEFDRATVRVIVESITALDAALDALQRR